ncbi:hypothetical protein [Acinetobacter pseudolwoffii]|uniref:hypothetical protein n=1 Tax=Acinetobacter pseudolwoffii TaxID=2053287 RepID=UPI00209A751F|nr:hypothetical protein [Acinetobacter pseudolwoffii]MCO8092052.1 hypothetical protein [Acinetobacter pseudolwoffii]
MAIGTLIKSIVMILGQLWGKLSPETKKKIIDEILKQFEKILRRFYQYYKDKQSSK